MLRHLERTNKGKPRLKVLYLAADEETKDLFQEIQEDLFSAVDLSLFWEEEEDPDILDDMSEMHLVVFPVTGNLLAQKNSRPFQLIRRAMDEGIPILPLLQTKELRESIEIAEKKYKEVCAEGASDAKEEAYKRRFEKAKEDLENLISDYNKAFQGRQYLDKGSTDKTELPFFVKLSSFLNSFLVDEKTEKQVKAAFDAHIFMSYRKRDRKNMLEFMRMIHSQKNLEDVAIWYDEFLTPGRNFDEVLKEKLRQCDLMTLAVTPNILEPGNYVHDHEYPYAIDNGVRILPVEISHTDQSEYNEMYPKLPDPIPMQKEEEVISQLAATLSAVAWSDRLDDDTHRFCLGLAYLYGIDTNIDREKGAAMIRSAAENGFTEAIEKYASMRFFGEAGEPSAEEAVNLQTEAVRKREAAFEEENTAENALAAGIAARGLGDYTHAVKEDATPFNLKAQKWLKEALTRSEDPLQTDEILGALESLSWRFRQNYSYKKRGWLNEGDSYFSEHRQLEIENVCILAEHHYKNYTARDVANLYKEFYDLAEKAWQHDYDIHVPHLRQAEQSWLEKYYSQTKDPESALRLIEIFIAGNNEASCQKALELLEQLPDEHEVPAEERKRHILFLSENEKWAQVRDILEKHSAVNGNPSGTGMNLSDELCLYGKCCGKLGDAKKAEELFQKALDNEEENYKQHMISLSREESCVNRASYSYRGVRDHELEKIFKRRLDARLHLKEMIKNIGISYIETGNYRKAEEIFEKALCAEEEQMPQMLRDYSKYIEISFLCELYDLLAKTYAGMKKEQGDREKTAGREAGMNRRIISDIEKEFNAKLRYCNSDNRDPVMATQRVLNMLKQIIPVCEKMKDNARLARYSKLKKEQEEIAEWQFEHRYRF